MARDDGAHHRIMTGRRRLEVASRWWPHREVARLRHNAPVLAGVQGLAWSLVPGRASVPQRQ